jgi:hypothetical protein
MRVIVELHRTEADAIHGVVSADAEEDFGKPHQFAGWLELLRILEALAPPGTSTSTQGSAAGDP